MYICICVYYIYGLMGMCVHRYMYICTYWDVYMYVCVDVYRYIWTHGNVGT